MSEAPSIVITHLNLTFENFTIFQDLSITFSAGKISCLLGESGVGKSSLLQAIVKQEQSKKTVTYLAQDDALLPWLNILDNALIGFRLRGKTKHFAERKSHAIQLFHQVGLGACINKYPQHLSGGQRQRAALVRTLMEERPIILMDEPFAKLDAITRMDLQALAVNLLRNKTVLMVTHDPFEALRMADHIYVMSGSPACIDKVVELKTQSPRDISSSEIIFYQAELLKKIRGSLSIVSSEGTNT